MHWSYGRFVIRSLKEIYFSGWNIGIQPSYAPVNNQLFSYFPFSTNLVTCDQNITTILTISIYLGSRLKDSTFYKKNVNNILDCAQLCLSRYRECKSINFKHGRNSGTEKICELNNTTRMSAKHFLPDEEFDYLEPVQVRYNYVLKKISL